MKLFKKLFAVSLFCFISLLPSSLLLAQQNLEFQELVKRSEQGAVSVDMIVLPGHSDSTITMATIFSLPYDVLPFKKVSGSDPRGEFYSVADLSLEVFKSDETHLRSKKEISVKGLESVARSFWSDTAFAKNYEESTSPENFLNGSLSATMKPGIYSYILQMRRGQETNTRISKVKTVSLKSFNDIKTGEVILGSNVKRNDSTTKLILSSLGKNVRFGNNFHALVHLPDYDSDKSYQLAIHTIRTSGADTSVAKTAFTTMLGSQDIYQQVHPKIAPGKGNSTAINLASARNGYTYALLEIPGKKLSNNQYQLSITEKESGKLVARDTFRSIWVNMPTSLYSLSTAIDMLKYITDANTLNNLQTGTQAEREQKFREFWEKRDPTPNTAFNELMAEYYQRIDYAYENFTTSNTIGYKSDQGEVYIKYGPPNDINRKFPTDGPTLEIWRYKDRTFVFRATSGFGDFKLVSQKPN